MDRVQPQNIEAEEALLGSLLIDTEAIYEVKEIVKSDYFFREINRWIYKAIFELTECKKPVDIITLCDELDNRGQLESVGGEVYVIGLLNTVPTSINACHYAEIVREKYERRKLISLAHVVNNLSYKEDENIEQLIEVARNGLLEISNGRYSQGSFDTSISQVLDDIEYRWNLYLTNQEVPLIRTGFTEIDKIIRGVKRGEVIIIGARTKVGKTKFKLNMAYHMAKQGKRVIFFSLEMDKEEVITWLLTIIAFKELGCAVSSDDIRSGTLRDEQVVALQQAAGILSQLPIIVEDRWTVSVANIFGRCQQEKIRNGLDIVYVDYLQLLVPDSSRNTRNDEVAAISRALKVQLAKGLDVVLVAASQLNRGSEYRKDKTPTLSDLRDSGAIEQDGDYVMFLHPTGKHSRKWILAANRHGPADETVDLRFDGATSTFRDMSDTLKIIQETDIIF